MTSLVLYLVIILTTVDHVLPQKDCLSFTQDGTQCVFPFTYRGVTYNKCTSAYHTRDWCSYNSTYSKRWGNCVRTTCVATTPTTTTAAPTTTTTTPPPIRNPSICKAFVTGGEECALPFTYKGKSYSNCTKVDYTTMWCSLTSNYENQWGNCERYTCGIGGTACRETTDRLPCIFPFEYRRQLWYTCITMDNNDTSWCYTDIISKPKKWGNCTSNYLCKSNKNKDQNFCRYGVDGSKCQLPFVYKGMVFYDCTRREKGYEWCITDKLSYTSQPCTSKSTC